MNRLTPKQTFIHCHQVIENLDSELHGCEWCCGGGLELRAAFYEKMKQASILLEDKDTPTYYPWHEEQLWKEHAYSGPLGDEAFEKMDKDQRDHQFYYRCEMQWHSHYEPLDYQILIYERHGLVPKDEEIKPVKKREPICFPWQGVTVYTRY
jgi:hypothetical protein